MTGTLTEHAPSLLGSRVHLSSCPGVFGLHCGLGLGEGNVGVQRTQGGPDQRILACRPAQHAALTRLDGSGKAKVGAHPPPHMRLWETLHGRA